MVQSCVAHITKAVEKGVSFQACKTVGGFCLTACERTTDERNEKLILLSLSEGEFSEFVEQLQKLKEVV